MFWLAARTFFLFLLLLVLAWHSNVGGVGRHLPQAEELVGLRDSGYHLSREDGGRWNEFCRGMDVVDWKGPAHRAGACVYCRPMNELHLSVLVISSHIVPLPSSKRKEDLRQG